MSVRDEQMRAHPNFPWIEADDVTGVAQFLQSRGWIGDDETILSCGKAGEGNMNLTLRVDTNRRTFVLKQARPWVEKYDTIAAPWDRMLYEQRFYARVSRIPAVASHLPRIHHADHDARTVMMEYLEDARDFTDAYAGAPIHIEDIQILGRLLRALHDNTRREPDPEFANVQMRALNHLHLFVVPLDPDNGLDLDAHEPGLRSVASELQQDEAYCAAVAEVGKRYLADGRCLLHGDYFPGSWLRTRSGIYLIDPEFCFYGDPEFDIGVCIAHLRLADQEKAFADGFVRAYGAEGWDHSWVARYAAVEVMRRVIGVAQLPIPRSEEFRRQALMASRACLRNRDWSVLWA